MNGKTAVEQIKCLLETIDGALAATGASFAPHARGRAEGLRHALGIIEQAEAGRLTPETMAVKLVGDGDSATAANMRLVVAAAIRADRAAR